MTRLYTDEELHIAAHTPIGMGENVFLSESIARNILDAVLPVYRERLLKLFAKVNNDVNDRLIKENKRLQLENEKLRADLEWQQFHR